MRIDPNWDYDRQRLIAAGAGGPGRTRTSSGSSSTASGSSSSSAIGKLKYPISLHFIGQRAADSLFYVKRVEAHDVTSPPRPAKLGCLEGV